ncbi:MAG: PqqD family protein [bacterium]|nr:PqqD family protein [bacterium]
MATSRELIGSDRPRGRNEILCRELDDGFILYDMEKNKVHSLNPAAAFIWESLDGTRTLEEIAESLRNFPGAAGDTLFDDVRRAVQTFQEEGLLMSAADSSDLRAT